MVPGRDGSAHKARRLRGVLDALPQCPKCPAGSEFRNRPYPGPDGPSMRPAAASPTNPLAAHPPPLHFLRRVPYRFERSPVKFALFLTYSAAGLSLTRALVREDLAQEQFGAVALGVGKEFLGRSAFDDLAAVHEDHRVGDSAREPHLVGDTDHCHPLLGE